MQISSFRKIPETQVIIYLVVIYVIGVAGLLTKATRPIFMFLTPVNILLAGLVCAIYHTPYTKKFGIACLLVYLGGFLLEWAGVETKVIFGEYVYGSGLGIQFFGVPPIMGLNWLILVYSSISIAGRITRNKWLIALLGAACMLLYDLVLEPSAIHYNFWKWGNESVPLQNYLAWFIGAFVFIRLFCVIYPQNIKNRVAEAVFWLQLAFFGCLLAGNNFYV